MKTLGESVYRLVMLGMFIPKGLWRRLGVVYKLDATGGALVSLLSPKVAVPFGFQ